MKETGKKQDRRDFLRSIGRSIAFGALAVLCGSLALRRKCKLSGGNACATCREIGSCKLPEALEIKNLSSRNLVWQLDATKCVQCGKCATTCVLNSSAVKCVHNFKLCGYCKLCFGFFQPGANKLTSAAENQLCPAGAIKRTYVDDPYYQYTIDESLCIGCGKCVKGCGSFGNGSLFLQVKHDRCVNCNECSIARNCPTQAFSRVPADKAYIWKGPARDA